MNLFHERRRDGITSMNGINQQLCRKRKIALAIKWYRSRDHCFATSHWFLENSINIEKIYQTKLFCINKKSTFSLNYGKNISRTSPVFSAFCGQSRPFFQFRKYFLSTRIDKFRAPLAKMGLGPLPSPVPPSIDRSLLLW